MWKSTLACKQLTYVLRMSLVAQDGMERDVRSSFLGRGVVWINGRCQLSSVQMFARCRGGHAAAASMADRLCLLQGSFGLPPLPAVSCTCLHIKLFLWLAMVMPPSFVNTTDAAVLEFDA